jgi:uncharacterized membrane protein
MNVATRQVPVRLQKQREREATDMLKSIGAILAGMITIVVLSAGTDAALEAAGIFTPPDQGFFTTWMVILAFVYRSIYTVAGGYVTARLAPDRPIRHAVILGILGIILGSVGVVVAWDLAPHWYPIALVVTALPCTWFGGRLRTT